LMPKGCKHVEKAVNNLRRQVEALVLKVKGEIGIVDAALINSLCRWERHSLVTQHWLRKDYDKLSPADRLRYSAEVAKASDARDKNLRARRLARDGTADVMEQLYRRPLLVMSNGHADGAGGAGDK